MFLFSVCSEKESKKSVYILAGILAGLQDPAGLLSQPEQSFCLVGDSKRFRYPVKWFRWLHAHPNNKFRNCPLDWGLHSKWVLCPLSTYVFISSLRNGSVVFSKFFGFTVIYFLRHAGTVDWVFSTRTSCTSFWRCNEHMPRTASSWDERSTVPACSAGAAAAHRPYCSPCSARAGLGELSSEWALQELFACEQDAASVLQAWEGCRREGSWHLFNFTLKKEK